MTPSYLGDLGHQLAVLPLSTSTGLIFLRTSDTGTVASTGRVLTLSRQLYQSTTGGKPLDATVFPRRSGPIQFRSIGVALGFEHVHHSSGLNAFIAVAHKSRTSTAGAGSTFETHKTDTFQIKMGTDTDATFHRGIVSTMNAQDVGKFYKVGITYSFRKASSTSAKDTTTGSELMVNSGLYLLWGASVNPIPSGKV